MGEPTRRGRSRHDERLVRPYVLGRAGEAGSAPPPGDAAPQAVPGGPAEKSKSGEPDPRSAAAATVPEPGLPDWRSGAAQPGARRGAPWPPATWPLPAVRQSSKRGPSHASGWRSRPVGLRWITGLGAVLATLAITGGVILVAYQRPAGSLAGTCTNAQCHGRSAGGSADPAPGGSSSGSARHSHHAARPSASHKGAKPRPSSRSSGTSSPSPPGRSPSPKPSTTSRSPKPSSSPSPTPSPSTSAQDVSVTYSPGHPWKNGFTGEFIIVNNGSKAIKGWQLAAVLPGDTIQWVWPDQFQMSGNTLTIYPSDSDTTIDPGATLTEHIAGQGPATSPTSCTFDGSPC